MPVTQCLVVGSQIRGVMGNYFHTFWLKSDLSSQRCHW